MLYPISSADCMRAASEGDFAPEIRASAPRVALVLTQSWCPQWKAMRQWLERAGAKADLKVYWVEYDQEPCFEAFMEFKENHFGNRSVPYVRFYRDGSLSGECNYVGEDAFIRLATK